MLSGEKKEYFRNILVQRLEQLLSGVGLTLTDMDALGEKYPDPTDRAAVESDRNFAMRIKERERRLISKIKGALEKIENGTYGICENCEEEISESRLEARPVTGLCIECKRMQETRERVRGR